LSVGDESGRYISVYDFEADSFNRLTLEDERSGSPVWSPDGKWLIFQSGQVGGGSGLVRQPFDGSRPQERLTSTAARYMPSSWSPDGQYLIFTSNSRPGTFDIGLLPLEGNGEPQWIISSGAGECCSDLSPDGKWLAYVSNELGRQNVYVTPFPDADVKWLISEVEDGGEQPIWSLPDGKELFYRSGNKMMAVPIQTSEKALSGGKPEVLFEGSYVSTHAASTGVQYYDISPDGQRFLMMKEGTAQEQAQINVVLNWFEELKRLVPTN
jgi:Tol biopolymer transport system component